MQDAKKFHKKRVMTLDLQKKKKILAQLEAEKARENMAHRLKEDAALFADEMQGLFDKIGMEDKETSSSSLSTPSTAAASDNSGGAFVFRTGAGSVEEKKE